MIRSSIEPGTTVWNTEFGFGIFKAMARRKDKAIIRFKNEEELIVLPRKDLTEIEDELKEEQKQEFNPPI